MKLDHDMIRDILLYSEKHSKAGQGCFLKFSEFDSANDIDDLREHVDLLEEAGLLHEALPSWEDDVGFGRLTWSGHEYVNAVRSPEIWRDTKSAMNKVGAFTIDAAKQIAIAFAVKVATGG